MPDAMLRLAVVIPTYDRAELLPRAIASVQAQSLKDLEIVVCDDCSTDNTEDVVALLSKRDPRIRYIRTPVNRGPAAARDLGIKSSRADYIATLDSDDIYLSSDKLERELDLAIRKSTPDRAAIGFSRRVLFDTNIKPLPRHLQPSLPVREGDILAPLMSRTLEVPRDFTFPKATYLAVGGYDSEVAIYEDWDLKIRMAKKADFYFTGIDGTGYVQHSDGLSKATQVEHQAWLAYVFRKNIGLLDAASQDAAHAKFREFLSTRGWDCRTTTPPAIQITERQRLGEGLIFLLSLPRSGSTLVQRMIAAHSAIYTHSEAWLMLPVLTALRSDIIFAEYDQRIAGRAIADFISDLPDKEETYRYWLRTCYAGLYQDRLRSEGATFYLDKTPRYHIIAPELMELFPRAKFILLWRHPLDTLRSIYECINYDIDRFGPWEVDIRDGLANLSLAQQSGRALEVYYEDVVANPEVEMRRIASHLRIPFESSMINPLHNNDSRDWRYGDVKNLKSNSTPKADSVGRWFEAIQEHPGFSALADGFLKFNAVPLGRIRYDFDEMRRLVPKINCPKADSIFAPRDSSYYRSLASQAPHKADLWRTRLARMGPIPYAIGGLAWRTYKRFTRHSVVG